MHPIQLYTWGTMHRYVGPNAAVCVAQYSSMWGHAVSSYPRNTALYVGPNTALRGSQCSYMRRTIQLYVSNPVLYAPNTAQCGLQ